MPTNGADVKQICADGTFILLNKKNAKKTGPPARKTLPGGPNVQHK